MPNLDYRKHVDVDACVHFQGYKINERHWCVSISKVLDNEPLSTILMNPHLGNGQKTWLRRTQFRLFDFRTSDWMVDRAFF